MTYLDDDSAIRILKTITQARLSSATHDLIADSELHTALAANFGNQPGSTASEGDLARAALDVLAQDAEFAEPIQTMANRPAATERYLEPTTTIAVATAAILVLQLRVKFKADSAQKWALEVEKKAASDGAFKLLVERLLSYLPK